MCSARRILIVLSIFLPVPALWATPRVIPMPQALEAGSGVLGSGAGGSGGWVVARSSDGRMLELAEEFLRKEAGAGGVRLQMATECSETPCILLLDWSRTENRSYELLRLLSDADRKVLNDPQETGQAYVIKTDLQGQRILLFGSAPLGVLYAATTLVQLWSVDDGELAVPEVEVRDYPDFKYRAAADWLMRAELNRWGYDWGDGRKAYMKRIKRKLDFCVRFKINMVFFDGFGWTAEKTPGYGAMMRELNSYARERGIKLVYAGFGANFDPLKVEPEHNIGKVFLNRESYPHGPTYACYGELRTPLHPTMGTCRSNEAQNRQIVEAITELVRTVEPGALYIHHEDTGHYKSNVERWKTRHPGCKARWPNDDFAAIDGGAGALAYRYGQVVEGVQRVRNPDTGYDAARDCTIILISPPYGIDSGRSGLADVDTDEDLNWEKTLEFWANAVSLLPSQGNVEVGFREIFPRQGTGEPWIPAFMERMASRGLSDKSFMFFLGGADQYSGGVFNYPYAATPVINGIFEGAEAIYNFSGGVHQEPLQVVNAEFSWNVEAPGHQRPKTFETTLAAWNRLRSNQELPEEVFGPGGLFEEACVRIYGAKTGKLMAGFFNFFEPLGDDEIPAFYPRKVYPNTVFWRLFQADSAYWGSGSAGSRSREDTEDAATEIRIRGRVRTYSAQDYALLQQRIAAFWRQLADVNRKGKQMVTEALDAGDVREDAVPDLRHLERCLEVGIRFGGLLASYHDAIGSGVTGPDGQGRIKEILTGIERVWTYLDDSFSLDTVDPKGGDLSSWTLTLEELRSNLLAWAQSMPRRGAEFR